MKQTIALITIALACLAAQSAQFAIVKGSVSDIDADGKVSFSLRFTKQPDFYTLDQYGRPANEFQFYIIDSAQIPTSVSPGPYASIIRGCEIRVGGTIVIRDQGPPSTDPVAGGWGPVRGEVPFVLNGLHLSFSVPAQMLKVKGKFGYALLTCVYGEADSCYFGLSGGPVPAAAFPILPPKPDHRSFALRKGIVSAMDEHGNVSFRLQFSAAPALYPMSLSANTFYFLISDSAHQPLLVSPGPYVPTSRNEKIDGVITIRPEDSNAVRGQVPLVIQGMNVGFSIPAEILNVNGPFNYSCHVFDADTWTWTCYRGVSGGPMPDEPVPLFP